MVPNVVIVEPYLIMGRLISKFAEQRGLMPAVYTNTEAALADLEKFGGRVRLIVISDELGKTDFITRLPDQKRGLKICIATRERIYYPENTLVEQRTDYVWKQGDMPSLTEIFQEIIPSKRHMWRHMQVVA